jgi:hypothetical protein
MLLNDDRPENRMPSQWRSYLEATGAIGRVQSRTIGLLRGALAIAALLALAYAALLRSCSHGW